MIRKQVASLTVAAAVLGGIGATGSVMGVAQAKSVRACSPLVQDLSAAPAYAPVQGWVFFTVPSSARVKLVSWDGATYPWLRRSNPGGHLEPGGLQGLRSMSHERGREVYEVVRRPGQVVTVRVKTAADTCTMTFSGGAGRVNEGGDVSSSAGRLQPIL